MLFFEHTSLLDEASKERVPRWKARGDKRFDVEDLLRHLGIAEYAPVPRGLCLDEIFYRLGHVEPPMSRVKPKSTWILLQTGVTVGLLVVLFRGLDLHMFRELLATLPLWFYVLSLIVVLAGQVVYAWRWRLLL